MAAFDRYVNSLTSDRSYMSPKLSDYNNANKIPSSTTTVNPDNDELYSIETYGPVGKAYRVAYYKDKQGKIYYWKNGQKVYQGPESYVDTSTQSTQSIQSTPASSGTSGSAGVKKTTATQTQSSENAAYMAYMQQQQELIEQQQQMLEEQRRRQEELAAEKQRIAQEAYDKNKAAYETAFGQRKATLDENLASTMAGLQSDYSASKGSIDTDSANSLREAYINYMNTQRSLPQALSAQGITGGAAETTLAGLGNSYGNARNAIDVATVDNLSELERLYNKNRNAATQNYNEQIASDALAKANYMTQLESDLANSVAQAYTDRINALDNIDMNYYNLMSQLAAAQQAYTPTKTSADNKTKETTINQGETGENSEENNQERNSATYANLANYARMLRNGGASTDTIVGRLLNSNANSQQIADILNQLGL